MRRTNKTKSFSETHLGELAALCGSLALLILAAVYVGAIPTTGHSSPLSFFGAPAQSMVAAVFPCEWFNECSGRSQIYYGVTADKATVTPGQAVTLTWLAYTVSSGLTMPSCRQGYRNALGTYTSTFNCSLTSVGPVGTVCTDVPGHYENVCTVTGYDKYSNPITSCANTYIEPTYCTNFQTAAPSGTAVVRPTTTTTYTFCSTTYWGTTSDGKSYAVQPSPTPCPSVTVTVPTAAPTTLTSFTATPATVAPGATSILTWVGTKGTNFSACELVGGQWGSGAWFSALPGSIATAPLTATTNYSFNCFDTTGVSTGWRSATVTVTNSPPTSCSNGLGSAYAPGCTCPSGQVQSGTTCIATPTSSCSNGLGNAYAPGCTCPSGQVQSGSVCVSAPQTSCSNGLDSSYAPGCTCPSGQVQSGTSCVASGVINSLTANPTRVRKGNASTVSWSTANMASCILKGPNPSTGGIATLSTALSSSLNATIASQSTYTLTCVDNVGTARSQSVTVNLVPEVQEQ